jgi:uncharacterized membrane protein
MKRNMDKTLIITVLVCLLPIILSLVLYNSLPKQIAIHWDSAGTPDNYVPRAIAVWGLPIFLTGIHVFSYFMMKNDPKKAHASSMLVQIGRWIIPILSVIVMPTIIFKALGYSIPIQIIAPAMVGVMIIVCGNYFPKCKQNYSVGIKSPWTLNSRENWNKTHHMAGYLWIVGGASIVIGCFLNIDWLAIIPIIVGVLVIVPFMYSYSLYRKGI